MKKKSQNSNPSVLLRLDCVFNSMHTIELAIGIAASVKAQLQVLFVQDEDLLKVAGLPFSHEISHTTALRKPTDEAQMQRAMRSMASQCSKLLDQAAHASGIHWSADTVRAKASDISLQTASGFTFTIIGQPLSYRSKQKRYRRLRRVLLIENQSPHFNDFIDVLLQIYLPDKVEFSVIKSDDPSRTSAVEHLLKKDNSAQRISVVELKPEQLADVLADVGMVFDCAVISRHEDKIFQYAMIRKLLCPVILVR